MADGRPDRRASEADRTLPINLHYPMTKPMLRNILIGAVLSSLLSVQALSQKSTVYAAVVSTKVFVVGAANSPTGLFYQQTGSDTTWNHTGPVNIRNFAAAAYGP